ncbi:MAG: AMP-binding protein [Candidatus Zixiibacteriota bacterium]
MGLTEFLIRTIGNPLLLAYRGEAAVLRHYGYFAAMWSVSKTRLERHRLRRLQRMLRHAEATSPFYRERFRQGGFEVKTVKGCGDIADLPFLTKGDLNSRMDEILSTAFKREDLISSSTGGSSGVPLTFYRDREVTSIRRAQDYFFNARLGIYPGTKRAWVWGSPLDTFHLDKLKARIANFLSDRAIYFYSFDATPDSSLEFLEQIRRFKPKAIYAYPNMLSAMAELARERSVKVRRVGKVIVTAEPLYDWQRELFKDVFNAETFERYGSREIGTVASEGPDHVGMYIFEPSYYLEVVDERGKPLPNGQMGELVVTDLYNYAMPLIRYRTGDMVRFAEASARTNTSWRRITEVGGRVVDLVYRYDGSRIAGEAIIMSLRTAGVRNKVQIVQHSPQSMTVKHLYSEAVIPEVQGVFQEKINQILGGEVKIEYEGVAELPYDNSGKYRYITSEYKKDMHADHR